MSQIHTCTPLRAQSSLHVRFDVTQSTSVSRLIQNFNGSESVVSHT